MTTRAVRLELEGALARRRLAEQDVLLQSAGRMAAGDLDSVIAGRQAVSWRRWRWRWMRCARIYGLNSKA